MGKPKRSPEEKATRLAARRRLLSEVRPFLPTLALGTVSALGSTYSNATLPRMLGKLLDANTSTTPSSSAASNSLYYTAGLLFVVGGVSSAVRTCCMNVVEVDLTNKLKVDAYNAMLQSRVDAIKDTDDEQNLSPALLSKTLDVSCVTAAKSLTSTTMSFLRSFSGTFNGLYNLFQISPQLTMYSGLIVPSVGVAAVVLSKVKKSYKAKMDKVNKQASRISAERLRNLPTVKLSGMESEEIDVYRGLLDESKRLSFGVAVSEGLYLGTIFSATASILGYTMVLGGSMVRKGKITGGQLTSYATYTFLLGMGAAGLAKAMGEFGAGVDAAVDVYNVGTNVNTDAAAATTTTSEISSGDIVMADLQYQYKGKTSPTITNFTCTIKQGSIVGVVGKNGTGKTTLISLMCNLINGQQGSVTLGGVTLKPTVTLSSHGISLVPQNSSLFDVSVKENVMYGGGFESDKGREIECRRVLELVGATKWVDELEGGLDFVVGEGGSKLSGGQRQRLSLARGLVGNPKVLLLDEPDTFLDDYSAVADAIESCRKAGMTVVVVTHHLHIVRLCNRVVELGKGGEIISDGSLSNYEQSK